MQLCFFKDVSSYILGFTTKNKMLWEKSITTWFGYNEMLQWMCSTKYMNMHNSALWSVWVLSLITSCVVFIRLTTAFQYIAYIHERPQCHKAQHWRHNGTERAGVTLKTWVGWYGKKDVVRIIFKQGSH